MILSGRASSSPCPSCRAPLDGFSTWDGDRAPTPGDVTICAYCETALQWDPAMTLVALTEADMQALPGGAAELLLQALEFIRKMHARKQGPSA